MSERETFPGVHERKLYWMVCERKGKCSVFERKGKCLVCETADLECWLISAPRACPLPPCQRLANWALAPANLPL